MASEIEFTGLLDQMLESDQFRAVCRLRDAMDKCANLGLDLVVINGDLRIFRHDDYLDMVKQDYDDHAMQGDDMDEWSEDPKGAFNRLFDYLDVRFDAIKIVD